MQKKAPPGKWEPAGRYIGTINLKVTGIVLASRDENGGDRSVKVSQFTAGIDQ